VADKIKTSPKENFFIRIYIQFAGVNSSLDHLEFFLYQAEDILVIMLRNKNNASNYLS
jgi:hypothetical protein